MSSRLIGMAAGASLLALALAATAPTASAQITLLEERLRSGNGSVSDPVMGPPVFNPTDWTSGPFPDGVTNFTRLDAFGLHVNVNQLGTRSTAADLRGQGTFWTADDFFVKFRIDQPLEYRFTAQDSAAGTPSRPRYTLAAEGLPPIFQGTPTEVLQGSTPRTGILPAGTYTLSGSTSNEGGYPAQQPGFVLNEEIPLRADFTVVAPEPSALPVIGALVLCAGRRRPGRGAAN